MHSFQKVLFAAVLLSAACASQKTAPLSGSQIPSAVLMKPKIVAAQLPPSNPEQGLKTAIDAFKAGAFDAALLASRLEAEQFPGSGWYRRSLFLTEQVLIGMDRPQEADAAMLRVTAEYPQLADYAVSLLADYHYAKGRFSRAAALYQDVIQHYPKSSLAGRAAFRRAQSLAASSFPGPAADALETFLRDNGSSEFAPDAALLLAQSYLNQTMMDEAVAVFREVYVNYPGTGADQDASQALAWLAASGIDISAWTAEELHDRARNLMRSGQYDLAAQSLAKLLDRYPQSSFRSDVLFRMGVCQFKLGRRGDAAAVLQKMVLEFPKDGRVPEALYWMGRSYSKLGDRDNGVRTFAKILDFYSDSEWADDALFLTGNIYREAGEMKKALPYYRRLASDYPESRFADSAIWWIAWSYYTAGDYAKADQTLQELAHSFPRSFLAHQARYWRGRIAEKTGNQAKAVSYYGKVVKLAPYTYYGYRAEERLAAIGQPEPEIGPDAAVETAADCTEPDCGGDDAQPNEGSEGDEGPPIWTAETRTLLASQPSFKKTLELMQLDMKKEAAAELWYLQDRLPRKPGALLGVSKAFFELGDYYRSLMLVLRNYDRYLDGGFRQTPSDFWLLAYPQGYWDSIVSYSRKYGQDPFFIASIIREESQFRAEALSPAGARGVMQVMPSTGEWIARAIRLRGFDRNKLFESDTAINLGTWYIGHLMKRFKSDPLLTAAAYNAGPDAVTGWIGKNGRSVDRDEFVESIPFSETRGYVKKVLRNYAEYRRIYGKNTPAASPVPVLSTASTGSLVADQNHATP